MINHRLWKELDKVAVRTRRLRFWTILSAAWLLGALIGLAVWQSGFGLAGDYRLVIPTYAALGAALAAASSWLARSTVPGYLDLARRVETAYPELESSLLAALEQHPNIETGRFGFLQEGVIRDALQHAERHVWSDVVSSRRIVLAVSAQFMTLSLFVAATLAAAFWAEPARATSANRHKGANRSANEPMTFVIEPGDAEVERGTSLLVLARVSGPLPAEAILTTDSEGESARIAMSASLDDPVFGTRLPAVNAALDYHVEIDGKSSPVYHVTIFDYPRLERADARLVYPGYTQLEERIVQDFRTLTAVEGTSIIITCHLNKRVASAQLRPKEGEPIILQPVDADSNDYAVTFTAEHSLRARLELVDDAGRANPFKSELSIQVVPNKPPTLKPIFPAHDYEVSALEELDLKASVWDDFGVIRYGLTYTMAEKDEVEIVLGENAAAKQKHEFASKIDFEKLRAEPDQLLSYYFWAEDFDGAGQLRRTSSDMYFAEVRQFDEIYRQGQSLTREQQRQMQQQQQQGGQNAQAAQQLAQLQKEIMNASWKLIRRETGPSPTVDFAADAEEVAKSQQQAYDQAEALAENLQDSQSIEHLNLVLGSMQRAIAELTQAHVEPSIPAVKPALAAEQAAYQGMLKLRAREHEIVRQQQSQSQSRQASNSARSQQQRQQMDQLEMRPDDNRYESQRDARPQTEKQEDRETRQVLNRLRELARRQHDLNERLKDLQSALQEAETAEKKEEIRRQLKRLEEEQAQMLRDTDELAQRMDSPENQERMSDEKQQLDQTREQVRRASEALENEQVTQAAAAGTRAEKEFEELRNEFRRQSSGRFNEQLRDLRDSARDLERREKELGQKLADSVRPASQKKSLVDEQNPRDELPNEIAEQRQRLNKLTEQMRETITDAEQTEPLLSERLYEAARNVQDQNIDRALDAANRSLRQGLVDDARQLEQAADKGIEKLREGVEKAAESVLGDEREALRRAREELKDLSSELNQEISRNNPDGPQPRSPRSDTTNSRRRRNESGDDSNAEGTERSNREGNEARTAEGDDLRRDGERPTPEPGDRASGRQPGERRSTGNSPSENREGAQSERENAERTNSARRNSSRSDGDPQNPNETTRPGDGAREESGEETGEESSDENQQGAVPRGQQQPNEQRSGNRRSGNSQPQNQSRQNSPGQNRAEGENARSGEQRPTGERGGGRNNRGDDRLPGPQSGPWDGPVDPGRIAAPMTGADFLDWSDRLRDVEEMVEDPELRAEAARIRDRARSIRAEFKRHSEAPNWDLVRMQVAEPLAELTDRVADEVLRRSAKKEIVPLDRDPVPPKYMEKNRKYYEKLGTGRAP